jgi:hypothetical protein
MKRVSSIVAALLAFIIAGLAAFAVLTPAGALIWSATMTAIFAPPPPPLLAHATGASGWTLTEQGFERAESCQNDFTIRRAWFQGPTRGAMFETHAEI